MTWIMGVWREFYGYVLAVGAALLAILGIYLRGRSAGRDEIKAEAMKRAVKLREDSNAINREVDAAARTGDVPKRVRKFYVD